MNRYFKLEDIKAGYLLVVEKDGKESFTMDVQYNRLDKLGVYGVSKEGANWTNLDDFDNHLELWGDFNHFKIIKIYGRTYNRFLRDNDIEDRKLLWKREAAKEMTIEEVQKELGYKIKIVEEKQ